jgi:hypothetical protein
MRLLQSGGSLNRTKTLKLCLSCGPAVGPRHIGKNDGLRMGEDEAEEGGFGPVAVVFFLRIR